jgi:hypothetical protein
MLASPFLLADRARPAPISTSQSQNSASTAGSFSFGNTNSNSTTFTAGLTLQNNGAAPQTAPLGHTMLHTPVTKGHNRTRSYQYNSPLNPNPLFTDHPMAMQSMGMSSPLSKSLGTSITGSNITNNDGGKATYNPQDPSTWAKRGFTDFEGNPMPNPTPTTGPGSMGIGISSSVPANFGASISAANTFHWTPSPPGHGHGQSNPYGGDNSGNFSGMSGHSSPSTPSMGGTVSPAIFQPGYTPPASLNGSDTHSGYNGGADVPMPMPQSHSNSNSMGYHNRRPSHPVPTIVPDNPRGRPSHMNHSRTLSLDAPPTDLSMNMSFTIGGNGGSDSRFPTTSTRLSKHDDIDMGSGGAGSKSRVEDDTLPSAALRGFTKLPFEGMLPEHDEPMSMG